MSLLAIATTTPATPTAPEFTLNVSEFWLGPVAVGLFKLAVIAAGVVFVYLGYRLFRLGIVKTSDVQGKVHHVELSIKRAAPGSVFALFGAVLIGITAYRGMEVRIPANGGVIATAGVTPGGPPAAGGLVAGFAVGTPPPPSLGYPEYRYETVDKTKADGPTVTKLARQLAPDGWELVGMTDTRPESAGQFVLTFRRLRPAPGPIEYAFDEITGEDGPDVLAAKIEERRKAGWELVAVTDPGGPGNRRLLLFRQTKAKPGGPSIPG